MSPKKEDLSVSNKPKVYSAKNETAFINLRKAFLTSPFGVHSLDAEAAAWVGVLEFGQANHGVKIDKLIKIN